VLVENPKTGVSVRARVNDRGPYVIGRIADLSYGLAKKLGIIEHGKGTVIITVL
jgi:rare lipoprotein A